jgi:hypothetical protein
MQFMSEVKRKERGGGKTKLAGEAAEFSSFPLFGVRATIRA